MARILITGSSDGLGSKTAKLLISRGHTVYLHARNASRAEDANKLCPGAAKVFIADLTSLEATKNFASEVNQLGRLDAIVHNAGLYRGVGDLKGPEGFPALFAVNTMAPYVLTCLTEVPSRLVYVSSGLHQGGSAGLTGSNLQRCGYGDSKLHNIMFAFAFARLFKAKGVECNAVDPGWVKTKMGGSSASDDLDAAVETFAMLAEGSGKAEGVTGKYWYQGGTRSAKKDASDEKAQTQLLQELEKISGVSLPTQ